MNPDQSSDVHQRFLASISLPTKFRRVAMEDCEHEPCPLDYDDYYYILQIHREGTVVTLHLLDPVVNRYQLPARYARVVSAEDIDNINMGRVFHHIRRKKCGIFGYVLDIN